MISWPLCLAQAWIFRVTSIPRPRLASTSPPPLELLKRSGHRVRMHEEPLGHIADARNKRSWIDGSRGNSERDLGHDLLVDGHWRIGLNIEKHDRLPDHVSH